MPENTSKTPFVTLAAAQDATGVVLLTPVEALCSAF